MPHHLISVNKIISFCHIIYVMRMMALAVMCATGDQGLQNLVVCLTEDVVRNRFKTTAALM